MQARLEMLRKELEKGQLELRKVENQRTYLRETMLRISGAIQVLEDLLAEGQSAEQNGAANVEKISVLLPRQMESRSSRPTPSAALQDVSV